jgi:predicted transport protein
MKKLGPKLQDLIDWSSPRLLCIAGNFTKYDEHAVQQINRNIELFRYRHYEQGYLVLELVNSTTSTENLAENEAGATSKSVTKGSPKTVSDYYAQAPADLKSLFEALEAFLLALGDDVTKKTLKHYFAFRRIKNFATVEVHPQNKNLLVYVKPGPSGVEIVPGFTRDVKNLGHFGTGDLEITLATLDHLEKAKPLLLASYESS